jgi:hypothetical protein
MGFWTSEHNALRIGILFRFIFIFSQYIAESLFDESLNTYRGPTPFMHNGAVTTMLSGAISEAYAGVFR